jgi:hypothetical protein
MKSGSVRRTFGCRLFLLLSLSFPIHALASDGDLFRLVENDVHTVSCLCATCGSSGQGNSASSFEVASGGGSFGGPGLMVAPSSGNFSIVLNPNSTLSENAPALAAFQRAAATWQSFISNPIVVNLNVGLENLPANVLGSASAVILQAGYDTIRNQLVASSLSEADDGIVAALPTFAQSSFSLPTGFSRTNLLLATKANLKAMGFTGLDGMFGSNDATISFSSNFAFDFDNSDGVSPGHIDFESVALHEIGHALGFISSVDEVDRLVSLNSTGGVSPFVLDLFRFANGAQPGDAAAFTAATRSLGSNTAAVFSDTDLVGAMSTGAATGDGRQASHWKDNDLTGVLLGTMDPTLGFQQILGLSLLDLRAFDLIGYDIAFVPEPSSLVFALVGLLLCCRRQRV